MFVSAKSAVDSGAHNATNSMHRIEWPTDGKLDGNLGIIDVVWDLFLTITFIYCSGPWFGIYLGLFSAVSISW